MNVKIGIGSRNKAKVSAVRSAFSTLRKTFTAEFIETPLFLETDTRTSVSEMPLSQKELMQGALERALFTYKQWEPLHFAIGLEGGVYREKQHQTVFLQSWAYAYNGSRGYFGSSAALPLPDKITNALYREGRELSAVIDALSGKQDVRSREGAFGILTQNMMTRSQSFEIAVMAAMTPFFNPDFY